ncbi:MAG: hypothetical protein OEZ10_06680 [Gammaproteobacteria bacterium]|nr:hypothetical protein [Gammaproteobacteria bacterium]
MNKEMAIKKYITTLPGALKSRYGGSGLSGYTEGQVVTTVQKLKLNQEYINYALLMFCGKKVLIDNGNTSDNLLKMIEYLDSKGYSGNNIGASGDGSNGFTGFIGRLFEAGDMGDFDGGDGDG